MLKVEGLCNFKLLNNNSNFLPCFIQCTETKNNLKVDLNVAFILSHFNENRPGGTMVCWAK